MYCAITGSLTAQRYADCRKSAAPRATADGRGHWRERTIGLPNASKQVRKDRAKRLMP
jgi:hypothetical protein